MKYGFFVRITKKTSSPGVITTYDIEHAIKESDRLTSSGCEKVEVRNIKHGDLVRIEKEEQESTA